MTEEEYDFQEPPSCEVCGCYTAPMPCWECNGDGGWHDCGEDSCPCLDKDCITIICQGCGGAGELWECPMAESHPSTRTP